MIAGVVLAAGGSARLGTAKQLVPLRGVPLVRRVARAALRAGLAPVAVVVGARDRDVARALEGLAVHVVRNALWREGIASSIRCGVRAVRTDRRVSGVVLMVCDQPRLGAPVLRRLVAAHERHREADAVASAYARTLGVPALFPRRRFPALSRLRGDRGAKDLLRRDRRSVVAVDWPAGAVDVDRPGQLP